MTRATALGLLLLVAPFAVACEDESTGGGGAAPGEGGAGGMGGSGPLYCLDPDDPAVHYQSEDTVVCAGITLMCDEGQFGFDNACGCGCVDQGGLQCPTPDDPEITWISHDPFTCAPEPPECPLGQLGFSNSCGCGCIDH